MDPNEHIFNDSQFFNDQSYSGSAQYGSAANYGPSGLTPYINGTVNDPNVNVFDTEYSMSGQFDNSYINSFDLPMHGTPPMQGQVMGYNPQMFLGENDRQHSSASSDSHQASASPQETGRRPLPDSSNSSGSISADNTTNSVKRNRFLERNRLAAAKCRTKKKEWTNNLEAAARQASQQTRELHAIVQNLRNEVMEHKALLQSHQGCDCHPIHEYLQHHGNSGNQS